MTKGILHYTNNKVEDYLGQICRDYMVDSGYPITTVSSEPIDFGNNIVFYDKGMRDGTAIAEKILTGLRNMKEDIVYFCEADVLYHPDHFKFEPKDPDTWYYAGNYWFVRLPDGFSINYDVSPLSGLVVHRESAIKHFKERVDYLRENGFSLKVGYEPMTHGRIKWEYFCPFEIFMSDNPNIDISHGSNVTSKRWSTDKFRRKPKFWNESTYKNIPGWDNLEKLIDPLIAKEDSQEDIKKKNRTDR